MSRFDAASAHPDHGARPRPFSRDALPASDAPPLTIEDDRQWASFAHLGGVLFFVPALVILLVFSARGRFAPGEAKEALNFQVTLALGYVVINLIGLLLAVTLLVGGGLFAFLTWALWVAGAVFGVIGFLRAKDGVHYHYPLTLRLIR